MKSFSANFRRSLLSYTILIIVIIAVTIIFPPKIPDYYPGLTFCINEATKNYSLVYLDREKLRNLSYQEIKDNDARYLQNKEKCYRQYHPTFQTNNDPRFITKDFDPYYIPELIRMFETLPPKGKIKYAPQIFTGKSETMVERTIKYIPGLK